MKALKIVLSGIYAVLIAFGLLAFFTGKAGVLALIILPAYIFTALALNDIGGKLSKIVGVVVGSLLALMLLASVYVLVAPAFGERFDLMLLIASLAIGSIGIGTLISLLKSKNS